MTDSANEDTASQKVESALDKAMKKSIKVDSDEKNIDWPLPVYPLVARFDVQLIDLGNDDGDAIVIAMYTGAGASFGLLSRENALALSSQLKKKANSVIEMPKKKN